MIRFRALKGVADDVAAECRRVVAGFEVVSRVEHPISVTVVPAPAVVCPRTGGIGFGVCRPPARRGSGRVRIYIGGQFADVCQQHGDTRAEAVRAVGHTTLHELAHYEQYRDRRPLSERGVNVRAAGLYRRIDAL